MLIMLILKRQRRQTSVREKKAEIKRNLFAERKILIVEFNTKINILAMFYSRDGEMELNAQSRIGQNGRTFYA